MNKNILIRLVRSWQFCLLLALGLHSAPSMAQETCERTGVEFGFFNGVQTLETVAQQTVDDVFPELYGTTTPDGQPISYTLYYNDTDAGLADFVETFEQRLQEQEGLLAGRFELFFSAGPCDMSQQATGFGYGSQG